jgi:hypothetical protein
MMRTTHHLQIKAIASTLAWQLTRIITVALTGCKRNMRSISNRQLFDNVERHLRAAGVIMSDRKLSDHPGVHLPAADKDKFI